MKKIIQGLMFLLFLSNTFALAQEDIALENIASKNNNKNIPSFESIPLEKSEPEERQILLEQPVLLEKPVLTEKLAITEKPIILEKPVILENDFEEIAPNGILSDKLTFKFNKGPIKEHKSELMTFYGFSENINKTDSNFRFDVLFIKLGLMGKLASEKEKYVITANLTPNIHKNFIKSLPLDSYIESERIPNHTLKLGTFRPNLGYEGSLALFLIPLLYKTQIARNLSDIRKTGISLKREFKYADYYIEGFSSNTQYSNLFSGTEGNVWIDFKPFENKKEKLGNLKIGGGYQAGKRHSTNYNVASAGLKYDYKNLWLISEYAYADGSNGGDGLTDSQRQGYNITLGYKPAEKLELLLRYDDFDNNTKIKNNNTKEYTAGFNYYIYKEAVVLMVNYSFLQNQSTDDSHRFIIGAQVLI